VTEGGGVSSERTTEGALPAGEEPKPRERTVEQVLDALRRAAAQVGTPISADRYDEVWRDFDGVSSTRLIQRFGTWNAACTAAGLPINAGRTAYRRAWTAEQLVAAVAQYLTSEGATGSYSGYDAWSRQTPGAPSAQTVRNYLDGWANAKARAQELLG
jgi:hypothetical protein